MLWMSSVVKSKKLLLCGLCTIRWSSNSEFLFDIFSFLKLTLTGHEFHSLMMFMSSVWQALCLFSSIPFIIPVFAAEPSHTIGGKEVAFT
jgi:hypothetical protein